MAPNKKRAYLTIIALGGVALLVDRLFLTTPVAAPRRAHAQPRPAAESAPPTTAAPADATAMATVPTDSFIPELPFPRGLPRWDPIEPMRDLFRKASENAEGVRGSKGHERPAGFGTRKAFETAHKLDAILVQEGLKIAVIDGRWLRIDENLDGCTFIEAEGNRARLRCSDAEAVLTLSPSGRMPHR